MGLDKEEKRDGQIVPGQPSTQPGVREIEKKKGVDRWGTWKQTGESGRRDAKQPSEDGSSKGVVLEKDHEQDGRPRWVEARANDRGECGADRARRESGERIPKLGGILVSGYETNEKGNPYMWPNSPARRTGFELCVGGGEPSNEEQRQEKKKT